MTGVLRTRRVGKVCVLETGMEKESKRKQRQTDACRGISGKEFGEKVYPLWRGVCSEGNMKCFVRSIRKLLEHQAQAVSLQNRQVILGAGL